MLTVANTKTFTNNGTVTATTALSTTSGSSGFTNASGATLNIGGTSGITTLTPSTSANTVNYTGTTQTVHTPAASYYNLKLTGSSTTDTIGSGITILGTFTVGNTVIADLTGNSTANIVYLGNVLALKGSQGSSTSAATFKNNTFFVDSGKITSSVGRNPYPTVTTVNCTSPQVLDATSNTCVTPTPVPTPTTTPTCTSPQVLDATSNTCVTPTPPTTLVITSVTPTNTIAGCAGTTGFSTVTGESCSGNTTGTVTTTVTYNFGTATLKNGSRGDGVKQLQMFLNKFLKMSLKEDGILGPKTVAIVKQWQKAYGHGLAVDGIIGVHTKAAMNVEAMGQ